MNNASTWRRVDTRKRDEVVRKPRRLVRYNRERNTMRKLSNKARQRMIEGAQANIQKTLLDEMKAKLAVVRAQYNFDSANMAIPFDKSKFEPTSIKLRRANYLLSVATDAVFKARHPHLYPITA